MTDKEVIVRAICDMQNDFIPWGADFGWEELTIHAVLQQVVEFQGVDEKLIFEVAEEMKINIEDRAKSLFLN